jgi:hypothetical protein
LAAADAHARLALEDGAYGGSRALHVPSYEQMFRAFSIALAGASLTGDASADAAAVIAAIRGGRVFSVIDAIAAPASFTFAAMAGTASATQGGSLPAGTPATFTVESNAPDDADVALIQGGRPIARTTGRRLQHTTGGEPGAYRVEMTLPGSEGSPPAPWIVSNPIYVGLDRAARPSAPARTPASAVTPRYANGPAEGWTVETSPASLAALDVVAGARGTELALRYAIGGAASSGPFAAFAFTPGANLARADRLLFAARADRPMRLSVQFREPAGEEGYRWQRSVYLDTEPREITVHVDDLRPVGVTPRPLPMLANVESILLVIDTVNTALGGSGRIWIDDVRYAR